MAARTWTPEQRHREAIASWKPWGRSTGPKSPEGKLKKIPQRQGARPSVKALT
jgi:hypothetical protein